MPAGIEDVLNEIGALAKNIYDSKVIDTEQRVTPTYDRLKEMDYNPRGAGWYGDAHLVRSSSFKFATETEALPQDTRELSKQFIINNVELTGQDTFTKKFLTNLIGGQTSFADYNYKIQDLIKSQKKNINQACYIGTTMQRTTVAANAGPVNTFTVANTQYLFNGMFIDIYDAAGTVLVINNLEITNIVGNSVTVAGPAINVVANQTIYLHEENAGATGKGLISLPNICDDGTDFNATFENISRTTYPSWRGNRTNVNGAPLTNDILQAMQNTIYINSGHDYMTEDYVNFVHPDSIRRYIAIVLPQKRYINASSYDSGMEKPDMLEWNGKGIVVDPDCGKRDWIMFNLDSGGKVEVSPLGVENMLGGTSMKWKSNYVQGVVVTYYSGATGSHDPNNNGIIRNLQAL